MVEALLITSIHTCKPKLFTFTRVPSNLLLSTWSFLHIEERHDWALGSPPLDMMHKFFSRPALVFAAAGLLRLLLLVWGRYQDTHSPLKYTDIDYFVFTDAARYVSRNRSPYARDTYRYTPLLAWLLYPTSWGGAWFDFGKLIFSAGDLVTGLLIYLTLRAYSPSGAATPAMSRDRALKYASIWLLNPMVANISTRGSSEGLLAVIVTALLWATVRGHARLAGALLGLGVHFKIYPFIYAVSILWWWDRQHAGSWDGPRSDNRTNSWFWAQFINRKRFQLALFSFVVFMGLNLVMLRLCVFLFFSLSVGLVGLANKRK